MSLTLPRWIAHRGGGSLAPENTLAGIRLAAAMGFRAVEFDVMLNGDGSPFLIHDETLERTTDGHGLVSAMSDLDMQRLDAGNGEAVPPFVEAARLCRQLGLLANVEIKPARGYERETAAAVAAQAAVIWPVAGPLPLLSSFSLEALGVARELAPHLPRGVLFETVPADWLAIFRQLDASTLHCAADRLTDDVLETARAQAIPVLCFTVNRPVQAKKLFCRGVSALFTDRLDLFSPETAAYKRLHPAG